MHWTCALANITIHTDIVTIMDVRFLPQPTISIAQQLAKTFNPKTL